jgi:starch phosphorylase
MHLADLASYSDAHRRLGQFHMQPADWDRTAVIDIASSAPFSSDRTIGQYAQEIWNVAPCAVAETARALEAAS